MFLVRFTPTWSFQVAPVVKNDVQVQETRELQAQSLGGDDPLRRAGQPTPVFLPGEPHGQRSLSGNSSRGHKGSDMTEQLSTAHRPCITLKQLPRFKSQRSHLLLV